MAADPDAPARPSAPAGVGALVGQTISGRYHVIARIGTGGMGEIYLCEHVLMKKELALKVLNPVYAGIEEIARRFEREAQSASRLDHPHCVTVTDFGRTEGGAFFLAMEHLRGEPLSARLRRAERLPVGAALAIARQVLSALEHAHAQGVVHRDIKPDNIMLVTREGRDDFVKLVDFGIAKLQAAPLDAGQPEAAIASTAAVPLTQAGAIFGTPAYMSPEQAVGQEVDVRSDLYSLGIVLYEMLSGVQPFAGSTPLETITLRLTRKPAPLSQVSPDLTLPAALEQVVLRALEPRPEERFPSATAFAAALEAIPTERASGVLAAAVDVPRERSGRVMPAANAVTDLSRRLLGQARPLALGLMERARGTLVGLPPPWRAPRRYAAFALGVLATVAVLYVALRVPPSSPLATPPRPAPAPAALARDLGLAEEALRRGELPRAAAILVTLLRDHGDSGRVHYLLGHLRFAEGNSAAGLAAYREAMRRDPGFRGDAALLANVVALLEQKAQANAALELLADHVGKPAVPALAELGRSTRDRKMRRRVADALERLGAGDLVDRYGILVDDLHRGRDCEDRAAAAVALGKLGDRRAIDDLKKARRRRAGPFGLLGKANACAIDEIDRALEALDGDR